MPSKRHDNALDEAFPPTDIREFIDLLLGVMVQSARLVERLGSLRTATKDPAVVIERPTQVRKLLLEIDTLMQQRRDRDAHYGWVLASDSALLYKSFGGKNERGTAWAKQWMRNGFDEYERTGQALVDAQQNLRLLEQNSETGVNV